MTTAGRSAARERRVTTWLLFGGVFACYVVLQSGSIAGEGYTGEEIVSGVRILGALQAWIHHQPTPAIEWSRHGPLPVLFDLPFLAAGRAFLVSVDYALSIQPMLLSAAIVAVTFLWIRRLATPAVALLLACIAAFGTMLWPYAYIGLETKQSFAVLLAGYAGLACAPRRTWPRTVAFAVVCGLAVALKSTGAILVPAIVFIVYVQFRRDERVQWLKCAAVAAVMMALYLASAHGRALYWTPRGGGFANLRQFLIGSPLDIAINVIGIFGSPSKGLFVYVPVLLAAIAAIPAAWRRSRDLTLFALLVTVGTCAFLCVLKYPADEVWGSRYLHVAIAPWLVVIGAAWPVYRRDRHLVVSALGAIGVPIAFLGSFYYYGLPLAAATTVNQNTLEWLTGDRTWNPIVFNGRLFHIWMDGGTEPVLWTPSHIWAWTPPPGPDPTKRAIDLRPYSQPQSFLPRFWRAPFTGAPLRIKRASELALAIGPILLIVVVARTRRIRDVQPETAP